MSIAVRGTLVVDRKKGRNGAFNVGDLSTEIGIFEVKDALIEEFEPGKYTGTFVVSWIEPDSFNWRGRVFIKNKASLAEIIVDHADEQEQQPPAPPPEPDPAEAPRQVPSPAPTPVPAPVSATSIPNHALSGSDPAREPSSPMPDGEPEHRPTPAVLDSGDSQQPSADEALFGAEIYAMLVQRQPIKLDPTVDRVQFRSQRDRLKSLGYGFDAKLQTWSMPS